MEELNQEILNDVANSAVETVENTGSSHTVCELIVRDETPNPSAWSVFKGALITSGVIITACVGAQAICDWMENRRLQKARLNEEEAMNK